MPRKAKPRESPGALERLTTEETARLLPLLFKRHPELRDEAESLAMMLITMVVPEEVANDLEFAFGGITQEDIWDRSGSDSTGGYTEPGEAADGLCDEALAPFLDALERLLEMGMGVPALAQVKGILLGFHNLKGELPPDAEDYTTECGIYEVLEAWADGRPAKADAALLAWVSEAIPEWLEDIEQNLAAIRKRSAQRK
jgi:hypothetical protein